MAEPTSHTTQPTTEIRVTDSTSRASTPPAVQPFYRPHWGADPAGDALAAMFRALGAELVDATPPGAPGGYPHLDQGRARYNADTEDGDSDEPRCEECDGELGDEPGVCECGMLLCDACYDQHHAEAQ